MDVCSHLVHASVSYEERYVGTKAMMRFHHKIKSLIVSMLINTALKVVPSYIDMQFLLLHRTR